MGSKEPTPSQLGSAETMGSGEAATRSDDTRRNDEPRVVPKLAPDAATLAAPALPAAGLPEEAALPTVERGRYRELGEHARGGMGRVLAAWDPRLGRTVAVKELLSRNPAAAPRFVREAVLTARLEHPSIVPVHEAGRWPSGEPFYAMKLVSGQPLMRLIDARATLDERLALLPVVIAVCEAVAYAHSQGVIHRDLKPDNVIVGKFGETVVIDWGLAKRIGEPELKSDGSETPSPSLLATSAGAVIGTPGYMAPEQARGEVVDERADVFALGAMLFATLAGRPPYTGTTAKEVVSRTASEPPPSLRARVPGVPLDLLAIVERATAREREARYPSAEALAADLKRFATGQLVKARHYTRSDRLIRWMRKNRLPLSIAGAALVVLAVMAGASVARVVGEKRRADGERAAAVAAREREAARVDQLVLAQATQSLDHDPTAALAWLMRLRPSSPAWRQARAVASEALVRGVALAQLDGHHGAVTSLAFAPDGARLFSAGSDGRVLRWDTRAGVAEELARVAGGGDLALTGDGARLFVGGSDGSILVADAAGARALVPPRRALAVAELAVSSDGQTLAAVAPDRVRLRRGERELELEARAPVAVSLSRDGARLAFADADGAHLVDTASGKPLPIVGGQLAGARAIRLSGDGRWLAVAGKGVARAWDLAGGGAPWSLALDGTAARLDVAPDGGRVALGGEDGSVRLWQPGGRDTELAHHGEVAVLDVRFSPDGKRLAAARGSIVRLWDLEPNLQRKLRGPPADVLRLAWSGDGALLASGAADGSIRLWRAAEEGVTVQRLPPAVTATPSQLPAPLVALSGDGRWLARVADHDRIVLRDLATGVEAALPAPPPNALLVVSHWLCAQFTPDVWCWDVAHPEQRSLRAPGPIAGFAIATDGKTMALGGAFGVMLVDAAGGAPRAWPAPAPVARVALAADGTRAAIATDAGDVLVLDGHATRRLGHAGSVAALAFSGDGGWVVARVGERDVVAFGRDGAAQRWLEEDPVTAWTLLDGEHLVVTGSATGAVRARDLDGGRQWTWSGHRGRVLAVAGRFSVGEDGTLRGWPAPAPSGAVLRPFLAGATRVTIDDDGRLR